MSCRIREWEYFKFSWVQRQDPRKTNLRNEAEEYPGIIHEMNTSTRRAIGSQGNAGSGNEIARNQNSFVGEKDQLLKMCQHQKLTT